MIKIKLQEEERQILGQYLKTSPLVLIRLKAQAILMRNEELKFREIARLIFKDERTIKRWLKDFSEIRLASLFTGHQANENASKLTQEQKQEIAEILKKPPSGYGLPKEFWDVPTLKKYLMAEFGVIYESRQSYHFLLKFSQLSFKQPDKFDEHRDEALIDQKIKEIRREIAEYLNKDEWKVFASDEVRIMLEALVRRAWIKKGQKTILKVKRSNEYQNYIGFLDQQTGDCHLHELDWQNQEEILKVFKIFLKQFPDKKICIIWDNAKFHKGRIIQEALRAGGLLEKVHLINFPPYAPDHNPIEHVWKEAKQNLANYQYEDFNKTKEVFKKFITKRKFHYQI